MTPEEFRNHSWFYFANATKPLVNTKVGRVFKPGELYLISGKQAEKQGTGVTVYNAHNFMAGFNYEKDKGCRNVMFICGGGIGDILAMSSLCFLLDDRNVHFLTNKKNYDVFKWFLKEVKLYDMHETIFTDYTFKSRNLKYSSWRRGKTEMTVVSNNRADWYGVLLKAIGVERISAEFFRPQLKTERISDKLSNITVPNGLLICNQSSCMMRNIEFKEIYVSLPERVKSEYVLYAYSDNVNGNKNYPDVNFIKADSIGDFFLDLYDAAMVITVDSSAIHFREGVEKPAICLFNSFTKEIRTSQYQFTKSFNISSPCDKQPCFKHELNPGDLCEKVSKWQYSAPCFRGEDNPGLHEQLNKIFEEEMK
jgi:hypothetical protein